VVIEISDNDSAHRAMFMTMRVARPGAFKSAFCCASLLSSSAPLDPANGCFLNKPQVTRRVTKLAAHPPLLFAVATHPDHSPSARR
jgi:hypothetical protein